MDSNERALLASTIDQLVASVDGTELTATLDDFGWAELLGGTPELALSTVFSALGRFNHWSTALDDVMSQRLAQLSNDAESASIVLPLPRRLATGSREQKTLAVEGLLLQPRSESLLIVVIHEDDGSYAVAAVGAERLQTERRDGLDPSLMATFVSGASDDFQVLAVGGDAEHWWNETVAIARVAICYSLVASMHRMVQLASEHAASRHQFGRPIGTFQAVRHRLAESLVATDAAEAVVSEVWRSDNFELAAAVAKLVTSNAVKVVTSHTQQVLAGIGFTAEHEFHRYMKRAVVLDRLFLNSTDLATAIGRELMQQKYAPRLFEL